jgi:hypothetical protein
MHKENEGRSSKQHSDPAQSELSEVWRELLGNSAPPASHPQGQEDQEGMPVLPTDPWNTLAHANGIEEVDLQQVDLQVSDQEVEQVLEVMQEQGQPPAGESGSTRKDHKKKR